MRSREAARKSEREGKKDIIWRFENQLLKRLPAERPLYGWGVRWMIDFRSNCLHLIIPIRDGDAGEDTKCYALTIHWSDRETLNSKSRLENHFRAAIRSFNHFLKKRPVERELRKIRGEVRREKVVDYTIILVGNYLRKYQKRDRKGRLLPEIYAGGELLALLSDAVGEEEGGFVDLERLGRFVVVDDEDLKDTFAAMAIYFTKRFERLKSKLSKSGLNYGAVKIMHDRLSVCVEFFKALSYCNWDSLRPVASLYSGHALRAKKFRRKFESCIRATAVT